MFTKVKDFGMMLSSDHSPTVHIIDVCSRASRMLGFTIRSAERITSPEAIGATDCSLVRQILEFSFGHPLRYTLLEKFRRDLWEFGWVFLIVKFRLLNWLSLWVSPP